MVLQYPLPFPTLASITSAVDAFEIAVTNALTGGVIETGIKNALRLDLLVLVRQLAAYVQCHCDESVQNIIEAGFEVTRAASPVGSLAAPSAPIVTQGVDSGSLVAISSPRAGAYSYSWRVALASAPTVFVQTTQSPGARTTFEGLTPGQIYNIQLNALGAAGPSDWSDDGTLMVV
jgi:hypothetical protein